MKFTPLEIIHIWNVINDIDAINDKIPAEFKQFADRFKVYARPEVQLWNNMSIEEREFAAQNEIEIPVRKINKLPKNLPIDRNDVIELFYDGKLKQQKSQLEQMLEKSKKQTKK